VHQARHAQDLGPHHDEVLARAAGHAPDGRVARPGETRTQVLVRTLAVPPVQPVKEVAGHAGRHQVRLDGETLQRGLRQP
jgi:hypothetical protein